MPSGPRRQQPDTDSLVFFLDRGLGRYLIAEAIRARGYKALPMVEVYPKGADQRVSDPEWIRRADMEGWVALTKDMLIVRDHHEVLAATRLRVFAFNNANLTGTEMVDRLDACFNQILEKAKKPGPYLWVIAANGLKLRWSKV